jgi:hypothetical protein
MGEIFGGALYKVDAPYNKVPNTGVVCESRIRGLLTVDSRYVIGI